MKKLKLISLAIALATLQWASAQEQDFSARDNQVELVAPGLLTMDKEIPLEVSKAYWRDVHGVLAAQIDGIYQYWQHHLGAPLTGIWPDIQGIQFVAPADQTINGMAEVTFLKTADASALGTNAAAAELSLDEQNIFTHTAVHTSLRSKTFVDRIENGAPNGPQEVLKFIFLIRKKEEVTPEVFKNFMTGLADQFSEAATVLKLRMHLLEPYDETGWAPPNVAHTISPEAQYQAIVEMGFTDVDQMKQFFSSPQFKQTRSNQGRYMRSIYTFPEEAIYTLNYEGAPTLVGMRSYSVMNTINQVGAENQVQKDLLRLIYQVNE